MRLQYVVYRKESGGSSIFKLACRFRVNREGRGMLALIATEMEYKKSELLIFFVTLVRPYTE